MGTRPRGILPDELQRELKLPVGSSGAADGIEGADLADVGRAGWMPGRVIIRILIFIRIRHGENRVIEEVEGLEPELKFQALRNRGRLLGREIEAYKLRPAENAPASVAEHFGIGRRREGAKIPKIQNIFRAAVGVQADTPSIYTASLILAAVSRSTDTSCDIPRSAIVTPNRRFMRAMVIGLCVMMTKRVSVSLVISSSRSQKRSTL